MILAGGLGSRLSEETQIRPKPLVEIGGRPVLWHIMKYYSCFGLTDFIVCLGFKGYMIKEFFSNYFLHTSDVTIDIGTGELSVHNVHAEPWRVTLVDTGDATMTGGRLKRVRDYLKDDVFCFTYGDGLSNVAIDEVIAFHRAKGAQATVTAVQPPGRFGALNVNKDRIVAFSEKPVGDGGWINGGYFVLEKGVLDLIEGDSTSWEQEPMERLAREGRLSAYLHTGFWHPMDTLRDKALLEELWASSNAPWKIW